MNTRTLFLRLALPLHTPTLRTITTTTPRLSKPFITPTPSPPRLSEKEQAEFERLYKESNGPFSTPKRNHSPTEGASIEEELHPDIRRGAPPEFEGDINPKTGEVGGPKNDPLKHGDYSFNGRVTDF